MEAKQSVLSLLTSLSSKKVTSILILFRIIGSGTSWIRVFKSFDLPFVAFVLFKKLFQLIGF